MNGAIYSLVGPLQTALSSISSMSGNETKAEPHPLSLPNFAATMDVVLKRGLDYKLVFECLTDGSSGMVPLHVLSARWPRGEAEREEGFKLPRGCVEEWSRQASRDGYLDWEGFSLGLTNALKADSARLRDTAKEGHIPPTETSKPRQRSKGHGMTVPLGVEAREIEEFLLHCEGRKLVQALALARKEVYRCQMSLEQLAAEREGAGSTANHAEPAPPETEQVDGSLGSEREELQKGLEILGRTQQWFGNRLEQLSLEKSPTKKFGKEELLAIMKGSSGPLSTSSRTIQHIQQINHHLKAVATIAPAMGTTGGQGRGGAAVKSPIKQRLLSDPGPGPTIGHQGHHHAKTSPSVTMRPASAAHVVGIEIPAPSREAGVNRSSSLREPPTSRRVLMYPAEGVAQGGVANGQGQRKKPRRSNSLTSHDTRSTSTMDLPSGASGKVAQYSAPNPTHQYPLRETVSLSQLQGGDLSRSRRPYRGGSGSNQMGGAPFEGRGSLGPRKSSSLLTLPSSHQPKAGYSQGSMESLPTYSRDKDQLRAKQVEAQRHILNTEHYMGSFSGHASGHTSGRDRGLGQDRNKQFRSDVL